MSDHVSGPRALADPACDITDVYAFASPQGGGRLVLVANIFPLPGPTALFSDAVMCRFRLRPVSIAATGAEASFAVSHTEYTFDCTFDVPVEQADRTVQVGHCTSPNGEQVSTEVHDENGGRGNGVHVFAGLRSDAFFLDLAGFQETVRTGQLAFAEVGTNSVLGMNALSIVLEIDTATLLGGESMFAVVVESLAVGVRPTRLERVGRPEIKNITLGLRQFDTVNRDLEIRDLYNDEDAFDLRPEYVGAYRARFDANLAFYDGLDGKVDWPQLAGGHHGLTELLLHDFLVVDTSKPFAQDSYLEIERAALSGHPHTTCGGRSLNDNFMQTYYTLLINAGNGPLVGDGVTEATVPASGTFPYLAPPNPPQPPKGRP